MHKTQNIHNFMHFYVILFLKILHNYNKTSFFFIQYIV